MKNRLAPRPIASAIAALSDDIVPTTPIADIQRVWAGAAGDVIAAQCEPVSERAGVVTVRCSSAVWAQELDLLSPDLIERVNAALATPVVTALRCQSAGQRRWPEKARG